MRRTRRNGTRNIIRSMLADIVRLAVCATFTMFAVFATCFVLGLPEMIGILVFGA